MPSRLTVCTLLGWVASGVIGVLGSAVVPAQAPLIGKAPLFERDIVPILVAHCQKCHGAQPRKAGLDLRSVATMLSGGSAGPVIVKGAADKSLLYEQVVKQVMPPGKAAKLSEVQIETLRNWINAGALTQKPEESTVERITDKDRQFWSFKPPTRPALPRVRHGNRVRTPIDAFVLAKLETKGLSFAPDADPATLARRLFLDLLGLPPTPEQVDAFLSDRRPDAYERLVDRLLSSPHYGERWGRHWLDAAGYADTVGGDNDPGQVFLRENMWRYRDYVVNSLNADKPFDQFLMEQLAGDEMDDWLTTPRAPPTMREHLIATGFLRTSVDHTTEDELNRPFERYQVLHDTIENLSSNLIGLTVACARCHDHKFDPIPQVEYYRMLACLKPSFNPEAWIQPQHHHTYDVTEPERGKIDAANDELSRRIVDANQRIADFHHAAERRLFAAKLAKVPAVLRSDLRAALAADCAARSEVQKYLVSKLGPLVQSSPDEVAQALTSAARSEVKVLTQRIADLKGRRQTYGKVQAAWEPGRGACPPTYLFRRGNHLTPGPEVQPGVFSVLCDSKAFPMLPPLASGVKSSGRRTAWARWLTRPDHPLTARVFVNRVWQHHFGEGIVTTPDNFGRLGARPSHPELLDWLAVEFVQSGWSTKALHRLVVTSTVYRQASRRGAAAAGEADPEMIDPGNQLLWRMRLRRVESEVVRDSVLAVSGALDPSLGGAPVPIEPQADGRVVVDGKHLPSATAPWRRSLYLLCRRNYNVSLLNVFDQPVMATNCTRRISSAVPLQSLTLLNDAFMLEQAGRFAARVATAAGPGIAGRIELAFRLALARRPSFSEVTASRTFLSKLVQRYVEANVAPVEAEQKALVRFCHMLLCANEFLYAS
jgi:hypothetical protein